VERPHLRGAKVKEVDAGGLPQRIGVCRTDVYAHRYLRVEWQEETILVEWEICEKYFALIIILRLLLELGRNET
jgi:hypothetical protein